MTDRDFAYWLQGFFELWDARGIDEYAIDDLSDARVSGVEDNPVTRLIQRHIDLVRTTESNPTLCAAVEGILNASIPCSEKDKIIRATVAAVFHHVIDPQHPNQEAADAAHFGDRPDGAWNNYGHPMDGPKYRC
jgi:hypothetical protein